MLFLRVEFDISCPHVNGRGSALSQVRNGLEEYGKSR